jgi:hypothetical protein
MKPPSDPHSDGDYPRSRRPEWAIRFPPHPASRSAQDLARPLTDAGCDITTSRRSSSRASSAFSLGGNARPSQQRSFIVATPRSDTLPAMFNKIANHIHRRSPSQITLFISTLSTIHTDCYRPTHTLPTTPIPCGLPSTIHCASQISITASPHWLRHRPAGSFLGGFRMPASPRR